jgi:nitrogen fixation protein NifU and related proteins
MPADLRELYGEIILDHNRRPRNFGELPRANRRAEGNNPLCGDRITVFLELDGERIADIAFVGAGCAISTASASMMTEALKGRTVAEARELFARFHALLAGPPPAGAGAPAELPTEADLDTALGSLAVLQGVREFPMRVKCATLAWHALHSALDGKELQPS